MVAAQAFHWFDHATALPEIARVLRPGGHVAVTWNTRDARIPWVRKLWQILQDQPILKEATDTSVDALVQSDAFGFVEDKTFPFWQDVNRESLVDLVASRSYISTLDEHARAAKLAEVSRCTTTTAAAWTGCRSPTSARATGPWSSTGPTPSGPRLTLRTPSRTGSKVPTTAPTRTCCSSTSVSRSLRA